MRLETLKQEFIFHCKSRKYSEKTVGNYEKILSYLFRFLEEQNVQELEQVEPRMIKAFLLKMDASGHKANYINDLLKVYKVFFRYLYDEGYTEKLLTSRIPNIKRPKVIIRTFSDVEISRMINYYSGHDFYSIRNKVILMMFVDTGIRMGELINLTEEQIKNDYIVIYGKGSKERVVPKSPLLGKWLIKYIAVRNSFFQYYNLPKNLFVSRYGNPMSASAVNDIIKEAGAHCNISEDVRISAHTFRHTYAQFQLRSGLDIYTLSRLLGHENISITQTYLNGIRDRDVLNQAQHTSPLMNI